MDFFNSYGRAAVKYNPQNRENLEMTFSKRVLSIFDQKAFSSFISKMYSITKRNTYLANIYLFKVNNRDTKKSAKYVQSL